MDHLNILQLIISDGVLSFELLAFFAIGFYLLASIMAFPKRAINLPNYSKLLKKTIRISWYNREPNNYRNLPEYNVFVKKIAPTVTSKEFHEHFSKYGNIISARLVEDEDGEVVGYGFVLYDKPESATLAIREGNVELKGKKLSVGPFLKNRPKKSPQYNNVYVKNIPKVNYYIINILLELFTI